MLQSIAGFEKQEKAHAWGGRLWVAWAVIALAVSMGAFGGDWKFWVVATVSWALIAAPFFVAAKVFDLFLCRDGETFGRQVAALFFSAAIGVIALRILLSFEWFLQIAAWAADWVLS